MYPRPPVSESVQGSRARLGMQYQPPTWGRPPRSKCYLEVLRGGIHLETVELRPAKAMGTFVVVGRADCGVACGHSSVSRYHAVIQFGALSQDPKARQGSSENGEAVELYLFDLGSTHGTRRNKRAVAAQEFVRIENGDHLSFGQSSRTYVVTMEDPRPAVHSLHIEDEKKLVSRVEAKAEKDTAAQRRQEAIMIALDSSVKRRDALMSEIEFIEGKSAIQELTAGQRRQIEALGRKVEKLNSEIDSREDALRMSLYENPNGVDANFLLYRHDQGDKSDVEDVEDRTRDQKGANHDREREGNVRDKSAETVESLTAKLKDLKAVVASRFLELSKCLAAQNRDSALQPGEDESRDPLDAFMAQNDRDLLADRRARAQKAYDDACNKYSRMERMVAAAAMGSDMLERVPTGSITRRAIADEKPQLANRGNADESVLRGARPALSAGNTQGQENPNDLSKKRPRSDALSDGQAKKLAHRINSGHSNDIDEDEGYELWVPPPDQTGDGNTALNAKYGY